MSEKQNLKNKNNYCVEGGKIFIIEGKNKNELKSQYELTDKAMLIYLKAIEENKEKTDVEIAEILFNLKKSIEELKPKKKRVFKTDGEGNKIPKYDEKGRIAKDKNGNIKFEYIMVDDEEKMIEKQSPIKIKEKFWVEIMGMELVKTNYTPRAKMTEEEKRDSKIQLLADLLK